MLYKKQVSVGQFAKKGEDYKDGDLITIANEGKQVEGQFGVQDVFLVKLPKGDEKNMTFNQTSINNIIDAYGADSKQWIGKSVKVWLILQSVSGKMLKVTYLSHPRAEIVESPVGFVFTIPTELGKNPPPTPVSPVVYPAEEIDPNDIPF